MRDRSAKQKSKCQGESPGGRQGAHSETYPDFRQYKREKTDRERQP